MSDTCSNTLFKTTDPLVQPTIPTTSLSWDTVEKSKSRGRAIGREPRFENPVEKPLRRGPWSQHHESTGRREMNLHALASGPVERQRLNLPFGLHIFMQQHLTVPSFNSHAPKVTTRNCSSIYKQDRNSKSYFFITPSDLKETTTSIDFPFLRWTL
jgi:hypothetical protein